MDIKELDKKQLILLTLLITFIVSIATGIITVSLMNQMPKSVPQTINNVIQRTIEKVSTVESPTVNKINTNGTDNSNSSSLLDNGEALVSIYSNTITKSDASTTTETNITTEPTALGQGIIISDVGLILVDSNILAEGDLYKVVLNKIDFNASVLKRFNNGFTILKISEITKNSKTETDTSKSTEDKIQ